MPRRLKVHVRNACRSDIWRAFFGPAVSYVTESPEDVTCIVCRRMIAKRELAKKKPERLMHADSGKRESTNGLYQKAEQRRATFRR